MRILRSAFLTAALVVTLAPGVARAQAIPFDIEVGYRFLTLSGSEETYRSQVNDREGFLIRSVHLATDEKYSGFPIVDKLRIDGADLGVGGAGFLRLDAGLTGAYRLRFSYRNTQFFSALQGFANPLGVTVGQQTWDRTREQFNVDLEVLPGNVITPLVGYTSNTLSGPGFTTYQLGQDEFRLSQNLRSSDQEFRAGLAFNTGVVSGEVVQGWRKYHETENLALVSGAGSGNNTSPVLDKNITASSLTRSSVTDINTPVTSAFVRGFAMPNLQLSGFYVRSNASGDDSTAETAAGSFASFNRFSAPSLQSQNFSGFFTGLLGASYATPKSLSWRAGGRAEWHVMSGLDLTAGYTQRDQTWDNQALLSDLFTGTSTFTGFSQADFLSLIATQTSIERKEKQFDVQASARFFGPFGIRLGYSRINQDLTVTEDSAEIVVPGGQGGSFSRNINRFEGALTVSMYGFNLMGEASYDDANTAITRVDYLKRNRERVRLTWKGFGIVTVGGSAFFLDDKNEDAGPLNVYSAKSRQYTADITLNPVKWVRLHGAYAKLKADSTIPVRRPQDFTTFVSSNSEEGDLYEAGAGFTHGSFAVDGFWSYFNNIRTYFFRMYRGGARVDWNATANAGLAVEWNVDRYLDYQLANQRYRADRIGVYLKWRP
jgi:hypothetical protein